MQPLMSIALSFPLVVFTVSLGLMALFWSLVAVRLVPLELFDRDSLKQDHLASTLVSLGFAGVPAALSLTELLGLAGGLTLAVELLVLRWLPLGMLRIPLGVVVIWAALVLASPPAAWLCHALHHWLHRHSPGCHRYLLGERVVVQGEPDAEGWGEATLADDPDFRVRLHGKPGAMPHAGERRVLVKYLRKEGAYRSVAEGDFLEARIRLARFRLVEKHHTEASGKDAASASR
jgi:hypothetical protein